MNRRSFMQKCLGVFGAAALSPLIVPWFKFKRESDRMHEGMEWGRSPMQEMEDVQKKLNEISWKNYYASITIDGSPSPEFIEMARQKDRDFQKTINREMARRLYGS